MSTRFVMNEEQRQLLQTVNQVPITTHAILSTIGVVQAETEYHSYFPTEDLAYGQDAALYLTPANILLALDDTAVSQISSPPDPNLTRPKHDCRPHSTVLAEIQINSFDEVFSRHLQFPETPPAAKERNKGPNLPSAISSTAWRQYYEDKEKLKENQAIEKKRKLQLRAEEKERRRPGNYYNVASCRYIEKPKCSTTTPQNEDNQEPGCSTWGNFNTEERPQVGISQENRELKCSSWKNNDNNLIFVESKNGGKILLSDGYRYRINRKNKCGSSIWYCTKKYCKASLTLDEKEANILRIGATEHVCLPDYKKEEFEIKFNQCKKDVRTDLKPIPTMYAMSMASLKDKSDYVDQTLYRSRNIFLNVSKTTFKKLEDVEISPVITKDFLVVESGGVI
ncbi:hypothetical protein ACJJTC_014755 [Scirpophaga incertulas]